MKRILLSLVLILSGVSQAATIISPLPYNIQNGQPADATKLMGDFNQIVTNVNGNAASLSAANIFTAPQQFSPALTTSQGATAGQVQNESFVWLGTAGGTADALTASSIVTPLAYAAGQRWKLIAAFTNTGAATININGLGNRAITKYGGSSVVAGDIIAGQVIILNDDGVHLQLSNPLIPSGIPYTNAGGTANAITGTYSTFTNLTLTDGLDLTIDVTVPNTSMTVTFTPTLNGVTLASWGIVKFVGGSQVSIAIGDLQGYIWLKADTTHSVWVLMNPSQSLIPPGALIDYAGTTCPSGYLTAPTSPLTVSRASYAALFSAIGTTWGAGDGSTTFGIPYFAADYASVQANANVGTATVGQVIAHTHTVSSIGSGAFALTPSASPYSQNPTTNTTSSTGGPANLAAGMRVLKCIKY